MKHELICSPYEYYGWGLMIVRGHYALISSERKTTFFEPEKNWKDECTGRTRAPIVLKHLPIDSPCIEGGNEAWVDLEHHALTSSERKTKFFDPEKIGKASAQPARVFRSA